MDMRIFSIIMTLILFSAVMTGCSGNKKLLAQQEQDITDMQAELELLEKSLTTEKERSEGLNADLQKALADFEANKKLCLQMEQELTTVTIPDEVTFASSSTRITKEGKDILDKIWGVLSQYPGYMIMVEGHTDDVQIAEKFKNRYASNWELSSARAHAVLHYLIQKHGADPKRLSAIGYGEYQPIADNKTPEGQKMNRRVVIAVRAER
jgi:chemotaxis protein MotB